MSIVKLNIINHADYGSSLRADLEHSGISKFYAAIESVRKDDPEHTLLLDAGDNYKSYLWDEYSQEAIIRLKTDVFNLGNHEFDWGQKAIEDKTAKLIDTLPVICSNVVEKETGNFVKGVKPYVVFDKGGIKYGVLGLITEYTPYMVTSLAFEPYKVLDSVECAKKYIPMMKEEGAEVIILLTHYPFYFTEDSESGELFDILDQLQEFDIDAMIGGHIPGDYAREYKGTFVTKGGFGGLSLPVIELYFDTEKRKVIKKDGYVIDVFNNEFNIDPEMDAWMHSIMDPLEDYYTKPVCTFDDDINCHIAFENEMGNLATDIYHWKYPEADFIYINNTGIGRFIPKGDSTKDVLRMVYGFNDFIYTSEYTGKQIWDLFERVHDPEVFGNNGNIAFYGFTVKIDHTQKTGNKVVSIHELNGNPIDFEKKYKVITSEYMACGGNGTYPIANQVKWTNLQFKSYELLDEYIVDHPHIKKPELGRYIFIGTPENDNSPW